LAVRVGKTRLIDNRVFGESPEIEERTFHAGGR
jgi:hypothetical protein